MHKIFPLLAASILSALGGNNGFNAIIKPGRSSRVDLSIDFPILSGMVEMSLDESFHPYEPISAIYVSSNPTSSSEPVVEKDYFSCSRYGPFTLGDVPTTEVSFTYELNSIPSQTIIERVRLFRSGTLVSASTKGSISYTKGTRKNVSFVVPIRDYWTTNGLEIRFEIMNTSYTILKSYSSNFYPPRNSQVSASTLKSAIYTSNSLGFYGDGEEMCEFKEIFDFRPIGDYIDNDFYYRLDIAKNYFLFPNNYGLVCKSAKLRFNDSGYIFPYLTHQSNDDIEIPLYLYKSGDQVHFAFNQSFYVNKRTLEISDTYQPGWVVTDSFYLPVNGRKKFSGKIIYFEINEIGYDRISTTIPLRYELDRTIIGICTDGDFCVVGGES